MHQLIILGMQNMSHKMPVPEIYFKSSMREVIFLLAEKLHPAEK
jgi:hypothetical protein